MIVVKLELWPSRGLRAKELAKLKIWNIGDDGQDRYVASVETLDGETLQQRTAEVPHDKRDSVWKLVKSAMTALSLGGEHG